MRTCTCIPVGGSYSESTREIMLIISGLSRVRPLSMTHIGNGLTHALFFESFEVISGQMRFFANIFYIIEIDLWGWSQCVSLAKTHRLICNMTYLGHYVTSRDIELRSNFDINFF